MMTNTALFASTPAFKKTENFFVLLIFMTFQDTRLLNFAFYLILYLLVGCCCKLLLSDIIIIDVVNLYGLVKKDGY